MAAEPLPDTPPPAAWSLGGPQAATPAQDTTPTTAPTERAPTAPDPAQAVADKAKDAVNKLRGLFGR